MKQKNEKQKETKSKKIGGMYLFDDSYCVRYRVVTYDLNNIPVSFDYDGDSYNEAYEMFKYIKKNIKESKYNLKERLDDDYDECYFLYSSYNNLDSIVVFYRYVIDEYDRIIESNIIKKCRL